MKPKKVLVLIIVVLCLIVLFQNTGTVTLSFLFWDFSMSKVFLLPIVLAIGFVLGYFVARMKGDRGETTETPF